MRSKQGAELRSENGERKWGAKMRSENGERNEERNEERKVWISTDLVRFRHGIGTDSVRNRYGTIVVQS